VTFIDPDPFLDP